MTTYIRYQLEDGSTVLVEADSRISGLAKAATTDQDGNRFLPSKEKFSSAVASVRGAADTLLRQLREVHQQPDEIEIKFGLKATGEAGLFAFGKIGGETNYEVTLKWHKPGGASAGGASAGGASAGGAST